ncbi:RNA polymerase sigma factor [Synoicihabitans lomoniglobus]|uniref:RNA polymerase sigma factor n=1 Tax=Synoicihabitans lomoniglobus TaxID=2909285 RepID=A0AAE9ZXB9_9BACT|nr:RNA polymerase sigma factor [Opitutaceae bacterium LMO-M01]WED64630.1 RNA polymerase sigma factor [Opitutaceae bacterium LMO-M01]
MDDSSDHELMLAVRAGELARLGDLFERHHQPLYGFLARLTCSRDTAEDLVQIVFQRILKYRHTYRDEGKFTAWLYHLARRVAADHFRRHARVPTPTDPADFFDLSDDSAPAADEQTAQRDELALMNTALANLPRDQRELLVLHRFQHLRHEEIGRLLNISAGTAKVRVHRALGALRDAFFKLRHRPPLSA